MPPRGKRKARKSAPQRDTEEEEQEESQSDADSDNNEDEEQQETARQVQKPAKRARKERASDVSLLEICKEHKGAVSSAAKAWVERCKEGRTTAVAELLTFIVQAAGSDHVVSNEEVEEGEIDKLVAEIREEVSEDGFVDYFKGKGHKIFVASYLQLFDRIIQFCFEGDMLLDDPIIDSISRLSTGLSSSDVRSFRYVGTLTACHIATSLIKVMLTLSEEREVAQRQDAAEARKKAGEAGRERERAFKRTIDRCHTQLNELQEHVGNIFQSVTTNRFRDTSEEIRAIVIEAIGNWTEFFPAVYLRDLYLKYLGWALSDQAGPVREAATEALLGLYALESNLSSLHEFTERFKPRFLELPNDVDDNVAVKGVRLLTVLVKGDQLTFSEVSERYKLLLEESELLRSAAADLVTELLTDTGKQFILQLQERQRGRQKSMENFSDAELHLSGLLHIYATLTSDLNEEEEDDPAASLGLAYRIVDALFDRVEVLHDWKMMSKALLDDKACERRGELSTLHLGFLLQASVLRACIGSLELSSSGHRKQAAKNRLAAAAENHRHELTLVMTEDLSPLLRKHQADPFLAAALISTIQHLDLELFSLKRAEETLGNILHMCASLLTKHSQPETIKACCQALQHCANPDGDTAKEPGHSILRKAISEMGTAFLDSASTVLALSDDELDSFAAVSEDEDLLTCRDGLTKVYNLLLASSLPVKDENILKGLADILQSAAQDRPLPPAIVMSALQSQALVLLWKLQLLISEEGPADEVINLLKTTTEQINLLILTEDLPLKTMCVRVLSDLYQIFTSNAIKNGPEGLALQPSIRDAVALWKAADQVLSTELPSKDEDSMQDESVMSSAGLQESQRSVVHALSRLVIHKVVLFSTYLPGKILSYLGTDKSAIADPVGEFHQLISKRSAKDMPECYSQAIITAFERLGEHSDELTALCKRIAKAYNAFVANSSSSLTQIVHKVIRHVFEVDVKHLAPVLGYLPPLVSRLAAKEVSAVLAELKQEAERHEATQDEPTWDGLFDLIRSAEDRGLKQKLPKSALRKPDTAQRKQKPERRISFKDANKIQRPTALASGAHQPRREEDSDGVESESSDEEGVVPRRLSAAVPSPVPRFHSKTRRGSQMQSPVQRNQAKDSSDDDGEGVEGVSEDEDGGQEGTPMDMIVANTAEQMPSGLFLAESAGVSVDQAGGSEDEEEEEEEVSLPRVRYRHA